MIGGKLKHSLRAALFAATGLTLAGLTPVSAEWDQGFWDTIYSVPGRERHAAREVYVPPRAARPSFELPRFSPRSTVAPKPTVAVPAEPLSTPSPFKLRPHSSERPNPLPALLADATLRPGDIVIFPDGARVFQGTPGPRHHPRDFVKVANAKGLPKDTRKILAAMKVAPDWVAWANEDPKRKTVAQNVRDVETTGSVRKDARRGSDKPRP
jgi:hypothetical protein